LTARRILVVTGSRADYGLLYWPMRELQRRGADVSLIVTGSHLDPAFGASADLVEQDGFRIAARVAVPLVGDAGADVSRSIGRAIELLAGELDRLRPDILLVMGDRHEMFAAACAAVPLRLPLAHIGGGENIVTVTTDVAFRAAITKFSHLHFVSIDLYARKLIAMGEEPWRIHVVGATGIDYITRLEATPVATLRSDLDLRQDAPLVVMTYHPVTMQPERSGAEIDTVLDAVGPFNDADIVFTYPGADAGHASIVGAIEAFARSHPNARVARNLGSQRYLSLLKHAALVMGNSSSGIIEAPSFGVPVVNIGPRQNDRVRADNVTDVPCVVGAIQTAVRAALRDPAVREKARRTVNPYGDGHASERIADVLCTIPIDDDLVQKRMVAEDN
jgi:GDP/UDP-N,N'-diacetylbacillosamine 2-epimerase (hydrolysing)